MLCLKGRAMRYTGAPVLPRTGGLCPHRQKKWLKLLYTRSRICTTIYAMSNTVGVGETQL